VGTHTLYIMEDYWGNMIGESNETNNVRSITFNVTAPAGNSPDLQVTSISAPLTVALGASFAFSYVIRNAGTAAAGLHFAGANVDQQVDENHWLASNQINSLAANATATISNSFSTAGLSVGTHTLYIEEDYWGNMIGESDEANNVRSVTFDVTAPDLQVTSISAPLSVVQGASLAFSYVIQNAGNTAAGLHFSGINVDQAVDENHWLAYNQVNSLGANATATLSNSISTTGLSVGTHTLYIMEDYWANMIGESDETNNVRSITFNVTAPPANSPDLQVASISAPLSVVQGASFAFSYVIQNTGNAAAALHFSGINVDQAVDENHWLAWNQINSLGANATATLNNSISTAGLSVGTHTLYIMEDYWGNMIGESNETNNVRSITFNVTAQSSSSLSVAGLTASQPLFASADFIWDTGTGNAANYLIAGGRGLLGAATLGQIDAAQWPAHSGLDGHTELTLSHLLLV
jgi:subtilase family serine protease